MGGSSLAVGFDPPELVAGELLWERPCEAESGHGRRNRLPRNLIYTLLDKTSCGVPEGIRAIYPGGARPTGRLTHAALDRYLVSPAGIPYLLQHSLIRGLVHCRISTLTAIAPTAHYRRP